MNGIRGARILLLALLLAGFAGTAISTSSTGSGNRTEARTAIGGEVERGRYLVEEVAKCTECHTPRNDRGELRHDAWLSGATIWIQPVAKIPN
jgi:hypothetical protein